MTGWSDACSQIPSRMKVFSLLTVVALLAATVTAQGAKNCSPQQANLRWFADNAKLLVFVQYLYREATSDPNSPWNALTNSQEYKNSMAELTDLFTPKPVDPDCDLPEVRVSSVDPDVPVDAEVTPERVARLEHELRKHRAFLLRMKQVIFKTPQTRTIPVYEPPRKTYSKYQYYCTVIFKLVHIPFDSP